MAGRRSCRTVEKLCHTTKKEAKDTIRNSVGGWQETKSMNKDLERGQESSERNSADWALLF